MAETSGHLATQDDPVKRAILPPYSFDVFNVSNTASFDIPIDDISQNINFNGFPVVGTPGTLNPCNTSFSGSLYVCPTLSGLSMTTKPSEAEGDSDVAGDLVLGRGEIPVIR